jgi:MarR family transcriptional regulator, organic hydroperoxide resistance regulator
MDRQEEPRPEEPRQARSEPGSDCDPSTCPCESGVCTLSRYARVAAESRRDPGGHTLAATEQAVAERLTGLEIDMAAMAACQNLYRAANAVRNRLEQTVLAPHQLTWTGWVVLWVVWIWEEIETRHVAEEAGISKGTLTGVVKTLEARDLVRRSVHPDDGRRVLLTLTPAGQRLMATLFPRFNQQETAVTAALGAGGRGEMAHLLRAVVLDLEKN